MATLEVRRPCFKRMIAGLGLTFAMCTGPMPDAVKADDAVTTPIDTTICVTGKTPELHNVACGGFGWHTSDKACVCLGKGEYCYKRATIDLYVPDKRAYMFDGAPPTIECRGEACAWNTLGRPDWAVVTLNNPDHKQVVTLTSSHSVDVVVCSKALWK